MIIHDILITNDVSSYVTLELIIMDYDQILMDYLSQNERIIHDDHN